MQSTAKQSIPGWIVAILLASACGAIAGPVDAWHDPTLPADRRADDLVAHLTLDEKIAQINSDAPAIDRLGIRRFDYWNEALHGVAAQRSFANGYATVFPQCIGLSASWDPAMIGEVAQAISIEARAKNDGRGAVFFCPNVNIFRDPRWGRGQETWGEDPLLTSRMAVAFIKGFQGDDPRYLRNACVVKHFAVHSGPEAQRYAFNAYASDRDLYDTYLPAFRACVVDGHVAGVMSAYNRLRGVPCTCNEMLLTGILRQGWGFDGFVVSDASASTNIVGTHQFAATLEEAAADTLAAGCDIPVGAADYPTALHKGLITEEMIDRSLARALTVRFRLGEFDPPQSIPFAGAGASDIDSPGNRALARQAARESIVLLKNDNHLLPLDRSTHTIAVIGPNADVAHLGNYCGRPSQATTPLAAIRAAAPRSKVIFAQGCGITKDMQYLKPMLSCFLSPASGLPGEQGLTGEYFDNDHFAGTPALVRVDPTVDFDWGSVAPAPAIKSRHFSVRWTGHLTAPLAAAYPITVFSAGSVRVFVDGKRIVDDWDPHARELSEGITHLDADTPRDIRIEYVNSTDDGQFGLKAWGDRWADATLAQAVAAARAADVVILCVGTNPDHEGESLDRDTLALPGDQENLVEKVLDVGKPTVVVLMNGGAMSFADARRRAAAVLEAWYPGEVGGPALADVLFGDYNPFARLPVTFYQSDADLPPFDDYRMQGRTYRYFNGQVSYPFGFGLSYSTYALSHLAATPLNRRLIAIDATITNTSSRGGDTVIEAFIHPDPAAPNDPIEQLADFTRVHLKAGESQSVHLRVDLDKLEQFDALTHRNREQRHYQIRLTTGDGNDLLASVPVPP
jgi:beta-glucosidase